VTRSYYRGATGALLVFDITRRQTFDHVITWLSDLRTHADPHIAVALVGNKADLSETKREVTFEEAQAWADEHGVLFVEASAKTGDHVEEAFEKVAYQVYRNITTGVFDLNDKSNGIKTAGARSSTIVPSFDGKGKNNQCAC
jgi:GTPase SAR1 family protein